MTEPIDWTTADILAATGGEMIGGSGDEGFTAISTDTRRIAPGDLFVPIEGERFDGHDFIQSAVAAGARGVIVRREKAGRYTESSGPAQGVACVAVADTLQALGHLARYHRRRCGTRVVALTGSNGKTTTRAMTAEVVSRRYRSLATIGNLNNEIGVPLTLFRLQPTDEWGVIELGMNHAGEIARLTRICEPEVGLITNIGPAHIGELGSMQAIADAKAELVREMEPNGVAILNGDDPYLAELAVELTMPVIRFGFSEGCVVRAEAWESVGQETHCTLALGGTEVRVRLAAPGRVMVANVLAAAAVGYHLDVPAEDIRAGLEAFRPVSGRMESVSTRNGLSLINDTYNANPDSMRAAFQAFQSLRGEARGIAVLGDMFELGEFAASLHTDVGKWAAESGVVRLYTVGEFAYAVADGAVKGGMAASAVTTGSRSEIVASLKGILRPGDWVLFKGSRGMAMETVFQAIREWGDGASR